MKNNFSTYYSSEGSLILGGYFSSENKMAGGGTANNDDFVNSGKSPIFALTKITKEDVNQIITGARSVTRGDSIQATSNFLRRSKSTSPLDRGSYSFKGQEEERLREYISKNDLWIPLPNPENKFAEGGEAQVYLYGDHVIKLNDTPFYGSWEDYFNSLLLHNLFFPKTSYELIGFSEYRDYDGKILYAVVRQVFVKANAITNLSQVQKFMLDMGFSLTGNNHYYHPELNIEAKDLHEGNVLTRNGKLFFIDTIFYLRNSGTKLAGGGEVGGNYQFKNEYGSFTSIKVMPVDENLRVSKDFFTVEINVRKKGEGDTRIQTRRKTFPIEKYNSYIEDLSQRGAKEMTGGGTVKGTTKIANIRYADDEEELKPLGEAGIQYVKRHGDTKVEIVKLDYSEIKEYGYPFLGKEKFVEEDFEKIEWVDSSYYLKHIGKMAGGGKVKFMEDDDGEGRMNISIKDVGSVVLTEAYPKYEYKDDLTEEEFDELGIDEDDMIGKIEHIEVDSAYKGEGYAKLLMKQAIKVAKKKGLTPIYLNASPMGSSGLGINDLTGFYEGFGFKVFKRMGNNNLMLLK